MSNTIKLPNGQILTLINTIIKNDEESHTTLKKHIFVDHQNGQHVKYFSYPTTKEPETLHCSHVPAKVNLMFNQ